MMQGANRLALSRRAVCTSSLGLAALTFVPSVVSAKQNEVTHADISAISPPLDLRGVRIGGHAVLRMGGSVTAGDQIWQFVENTQVQWRSGYGDTVIESRRGRLHLTPQGGGKLIEISTGPVDEMLPITSAEYGLARQRGVESLVLASQPLAISDMWAIIDDPMSAALPNDVSEFRVFRREAGSTRRVFWAMRSPWLPALGESTQAPAMTWRATGTLTSWQDEDVSAAV